MVEQGARHLVYLSRSSSSENKENQAFFRQLLSQGCNVTAARGSVANTADVVAAVAVAQAHKPLKGIMNMSMVLRDQNFATMIHQEWTEATQPKVQGTWNLHKACAQLNISLDFFVLFSSISGVVGQRGQANYAAANTFLDAFVQYRHSLDLAAGVIDIGLMLDHGALADSPQLLARLKAAGEYGVRVNQLLDCLEGVIRAPYSPPSGNLQTEARSVGVYVEQSQLILGLRSETGLDHPNNRQPWKADRRMAIYHNSTNYDVSPSFTSVSAGNKVAAVISEALNDVQVLSKEPTAVFFAGIIARQLFQLLLRPVEEDAELDLSQSLTEAGLDSLVAIEVRGWWKSSFGTDISVLEMLSLPSLLSLGQLAAQRLRDKIE